MICPVVARVKAVIVPPPASQSTFSVFSVSFPPSSVSVAPEAMLTAMLGSNCDEVCSPEAMAKPLLGVAVPVLYHHFMPAFNTAGGTGV